jgi:HSP90 family molecular chaperone
VSNASDALEKARHRQVAGEPLVEADTPLAIRITTDEAAGTITIADSGIGMDKQELMDNLGTIARSGSKAFIAKLRESGGAGASDVGSKIIGQFGVGFYSAFMVSDSVNVYTQSAVPGAPAWVWSSTGDGSYEVAPASGVPRGSRVVIQLRDTSKQFAVAATVKDIISKYSNFVTFPIFLNDKQVRAAWQRVLLCAPECRMSVGRSLWV